MSGVLVLKNRGYVFLSDSRGVRLAYDTCWGRERVSEREKRSKKRVRKSLRARQREKERERDLERR